MALRPNNKSCTLVGVKLKSIKASLGGAKTNSLISFAKLT